MKSEEQIIERKKVYNLYIGEFIKSALAVLMGFSLGKHHILLGTIFAILYVLAVWFSVRANKK